jgi:type III secretion protein J
LRRFLKINDFALWGIACRLLRVLVPAVGLIVTGCGSKLELYNSLTENEANQMLAVLLRSGIDADKTISKTGATILVDSARIPQAVALLNAEGLPRPKYASMSELFAKQGLISSPTEERVRYIYGITQELSHTLSQIDGVLSARVHVVLPENSPVGANVSPSSAAVLIRYAPSSPIDVQVPKIKELVVNSIQGLTYDRVAVILVKAEPEEVPLSIADATPNPPPQPVPVLLYALAGGAMVSLIGNGALAYVLLRRRLSLKAATGGAAGIPAAI